MINLLALAAGLSTSVKVGWIVWVAWAIVQVAWYRRGRVPVPPAPAGAPRARSTRLSVDATKSPAAVARPPVKPLSTGGSPEFLAALALEEQDRVEKEPDDGNEGS